MPYEKVGKNEPVCIADEVPFEIPENWEWIRLGSIVETNIGLTYKPRDKVDEKNKVINSYLDSEYFEYDSGSALLKIKAKLKMDEEFELFLKYHLATYEKRELLGSSSHLLYICKKET